MQFTKQLNLTEFRFWSGAKQHLFTYNELNELEHALNEVYCETIPTETQINDLFCFEEEILCDWIGLDYNEYENRN